MTADSSPDHIKFKFGTAEGPSDLESGYGITMAAMCGFPTDVITDAQRFKQVGFG
jgi:DNA mismatch repair ATPase MutS